MILQDDELDSMKAASSEQEWNSACDAVKGRRHGEYPPDWYERVILSGLLANVRRNW
jgi:hypothetical protein